MSTTNSPERFTARRLNDTSRVWVVVDADDVLPPWPFSQYTSGDENRMAAERTAETLNRSFGAESKCPACGAA